MPKNKSWEYVVFIATVVNLLSDVYEEGKDPVWDDEKILMQQALCK